MEQSIRRLPDAELEVMQALWSCTIPATSREIEAALPADRPMAQTTVLTLLSRLADRGMVTVEKAGRRSLYTPAVSREQYTAAQSRTLFRKLCGGSVPAFAAALCDSGLTREELQTLRDLLERDAL